MSLAAFVYLNQVLVLSLMKPSVLNVQYSRDTVSRIKPGTMDRKIQQLENQVLEQKKSLHMDSMDDWTPLGSALDRTLSRLKNALPAKDSFLQIEVGPIKAPELNAIRRVLLADMRTLAIDVIKIEQNSSVMWDEMLTSRIAYVPLRCPPEMLRDNKCVVLISLVVRNTTSKMKEVWSDDLEINTPAVSAQPGIRIVRLLPGQEIVLCAWARPGSGREHSKWRAVHTAAVTPGTTPHSQCLTVECNFQHSAKQALLLSIEELVAQCNHLKQSLAEPTGAPVYAEEQDQTVLGSREYA